MACPFSRAFAKTRVQDGDENSESTNTSLKDDEASRSGRTRKAARAKPSRQSSVQITSSLLGEDIEEEEDTQTLNLKHLRAAVLVLTNPSVRDLKIYHFMLFLSYSHLLFISITMDKKIFRNNCLYFINVRLTMVGRDDQCVEKFLTFNWELKNSKILPEHLFES